MNNPSSVLDTLRIEPQRCISEFAYKSSSARNLLRVLESPPLSWLLPPLSSLPFSVRYGSAGSTGQDDACITLASINGARLGYWDYGRRPKSIIQNKFWRSCSARHQRDFETLAR
jgi:hypothetical protein